MNNNGFDFLYQINNKNNTFMSLSGTMINNIPDQKAKTLKSFMKVIPLKINPSLNEILRPLSAPKKKKKKNKHIRISAKNIKKKENKKISMSNDKTIIKVPEKKNETSRDNKVLNIIFVHKQHSSKSESHKYKSEKKKKMKKNKNLNSENDKIQKNSSSNETENNINDNIKKYTAKYKYKSQLNTIEENDFKKESKKKQKSNSNIFLEEQKNNNNNNNIKSKILFQGKKNEKINVIQIKNPLKKTITKHNSEENLTMNSSHNIDFTSSYRNDKSFISNRFSIDFSDKIQKINKNIFSSIENSKSTTTINSKNNNIDNNTNKNSKKNIQNNNKNINKNNNNNNKNNNNNNNINNNLINNNNNNLIIDKKKLSNSIPLKSFKVKSSEIKSIFQKEEISERILRIRKSFQEKEINQSLQNLNLHFYLILPGNASYLIKNCMYHRTNWKEPFSKVSSFYNFKWSELSYGIEYSSLSKNNIHKQIVNHFENHFCISNKANMFIYLMKYCEERKISVFKYVPFTIIFKIKERRKDKENDIKNFDKENQENKDKLKKFILNSEKYICDYNDIGNYYYKESFIKESEKRKIIEEKKNHKKKNKNKENKEEEKKLEEKVNDNIIENNNKEEEKKLEENIEEIKLNNNEIYNFYCDFFPKLKPNDRIVLSTNEYLEKEKKEKKNKTQRMIGGNTLIELPKTHETGKNMWLVKAINLNRGKCIKVVNSFEQIEKVIEKFRLGVKYGFTKENLDEIEESIYKKDKISEDNKEEKNNDKKENINSENKNKENNNKENNSNDNNNNDNNNKENINKDKKLKKKKKNESNKEINNNKTSNKENIKNQSPNKDNNNEPEEKTYLCKKILIQKYIENPLLYKGRKCDMRIWVLLTHKMKVYVFKEGHLKTCSVNYDVNSKDAFTHITNYSFQKYNNNFQKFEKGNEVPFYEFQKFINEKYPEKKYNLKVNLMEKIKEIINLTMRAGKDKINKNNRNYQFEIFGYDFMLDKDFNVFLIEINTNPGLEESSPWIKIIIPRMLDDALRLTLDSLFEPKYDFSLNYKNKEDENNAKNVNEYLKNNINPNAVDNIVNNNNINNNNNNIEENKDNKKDLNFNNNNISENSNNDLNQKEEKIEEKNEDNNKNDKENETKNEINSNNTINIKYISPFPVPGYSLDENLWDFICDLNEKDPLDEKLDDKEDENQTYTGIKHLMKKKKNNMKK